MKKPTIIIGKKQIIMSCLTLMLAVAVYINYASAPSLSKSESKQTSSTSSGDVINYGESEFVNSDLSAASDYFAQARLDKMNNRDEAVQTLQTIIGGGDLQRMKWL